MLDLNMSLARRQCGPKILLDSLSQKSQILLVSLFLIPDTPRFTLTSQILQDSLSLIPDTPGFTPTSQTL
ncbi:hypothetical protein scyTo_0017156 [Scyliorhinus torazame]|uniref:Uncharacterized protein n=1 Tax=Scyliorhinus torazame TaxID=75743 RepID=A0A401Q4S6_SCYTO|nr:hypothetical protein [Scyliorhinus torazame]